METEKEGGKEKGSEKENSCLCNDKNNLLQVYCNLQLYIKKNIKIHYTILILKYRSKVYRAGDIFILQMRKVQLREVELICSNSND